MKERGLEPKVNFFCTKTVQLRPRAEQTDATQAYCTTFLHEALQWCS